MDRQRVLYRRDDSAVPVFENSPHGTVEPLEVLPHEVWPHSAPLRDALRELPEAAASFGQPDDLVKHLKRAHAAAVRHLDVAHPDSLLERRDVNFERLVIERLAVSHPREAVRPVNLHLLRHVSATSFPHLLGNCRNYVEPCHLDSEGVYVYPNDIFLNKTGYVGRGLVAERAEYPPYCRD